MAERRFILLAATLAVAASAPVVAGVLTPVAQVLSLCIASCAAAFAVAAGLGLDRYFVTTGASEPGAVIAEIVRCAEHAAKDGVGGLESISLGRGSPGLRRGLQLVLAGEEPDSIRRRLERELDETLERRARVGGSREAWLGAAPVLGAVVLGATVIGLIASGGTPAGLGTGAAAGVFGGLLACMIAMMVHPSTPAELAQREAADVLARTLVIRGVSLIASGTSPRGVEEELRSLLPLRQAQVSARRAA